MIVQCKTKLKLLAEANFVVRLAYVRFVLQLGPHGIFGHKNDTRGKKKIPVAPVPHAGTLAEPFEEPLGTLLNEESRRNTQTVTLKTVAPFIKEHFEDF